MKASATPGPCPRDFGIDLDPLRLSADPDGQAHVVEAFTRLRPDWARLSQRIVFKPDSYSRCRLYGDDNLEVLLLCWLPGHATPVHDHGASWGVSMPICGTLVESAYRQRGAGLALERTVRATLTIGEVAIERGDTIHQVENASSAPAVSLHVYSPPLARYGAYDVDTGIATPVAPPADPCG